MAVLPPDTLDTIVGVQPAPRVLFVYETDDLRSAAEELHAQLIEEIPTAEVVPADGLGSIRTNPYGLAVVFGDSTIPTAMHIVQFGGIRSKRSKVGMLGGRESWLRNRDSVSRQWIVDASQDVRVRHLATQDLLPLVPVGSRTPDGFSGMTSTYPPTEWDATQSLRPILRDPDGNLLALAYKYKADFWMWLLPEGANHLKWVRLVLAELQELEPDRFPMRSGWANVRPYMTAEERAAADELVKIEEDEARLVAELAARRVDAEKAQIEARTAAEAGWRRLVQQQGDPLVATVREALQWLGFDVTDADEEGVKGDLLEDLQVRPVAGSEVVCLAEVRGYKGGAQVNDFQRIARFCQRYARVTEHDPDRRWYIVNEFIGKPPVDRGRPMSGNPTEVETFGEDGGLVVSTHDLLALVLRVERQEMDPAAARAMLWDQRGYFELSADTAVVAEVDDPPPSDEKVLSG